MSYSSCCLKGFAWDGTPTGSVTTLARNQAYVSGDNPKVAILLIHDLFGWEFPNLRLLADHFATEIGATVYLPDFFAGESLDREKILAEKWAEIDLHGFIGRHSREAREPEIFACAEALREKGFEKVGAVGYCFGGWAGFRLASQSYKDTGRSLVDCVTIGHPSLLTKEDIEGVRKDVPFQVLAPEIDYVYTAELKLHTFVTLQKLGVSFDYQHYPGVAHACFCRGDPNKEGERDAMERGKRAAVEWAREWLLQKQK